MKFIRMVAGLIFTILPFQSLFAQNQQSGIDSLVTLLQTAGREWNNYAKPLIEIGEPAVPALIRSAENRNLTQWNRRIAIMTLNDIHSSQWKRPALKILFNRNEENGLRNQVTAGLRGYELSVVRKDLLKVYQEFQNEFQKLNIAGLLVKADSCMAYEAFLELYKRYDGFVKRSALLNLVLLRPSESTTWYLDGLKSDDWMTGNLAMDSLISSRLFHADEFISLYNKPDVTEKTKWRIVYIISHRREKEMIPLLSEAFREESWLIHTEAAIALSRFEEELIIPEMNKWVHDPRPYVANNSRWVIKHLKKSDPKY